MSTTNHSTTIQQNSKYTFRDEYALPEFIQTKFQNVMMIVQLFWLADAIRGCSNLLAYTYACYYYSSNPCNYSIPYSQLKAYSKPMVYV